MGNLAGILQDFSDPHNKGSKNRQLGSADVPPLYFYHRTIAIAELQVSLSQSTRL